MISIKGLDRADVLAALYNAARPQGMGFMHYNPKPMTKKEAEKCLERSSYFDYLHGRVMKLDLSSNEEFDDRLYDRDNGEGCALSVIDELRKTHDPNSPRIQETGDYNLQKGIEVTENDIERRKRMRR